jgi:hypothetical protein
MRKRIIAGAVILLLPVIIIPIRKAIKKGK